MDILSLPDEMLVSVMKYIKFDELRNLRKTSQRIDRVAKRAGLGIRVPVERLRLNFYNGYSIQFFNENAEEAYITVESSTCTDYSEFNLCLVRVSVLNELTLEGSLDETALTAVQNHQKSFRQIEKLSFERVNFASSAYLVKSLIRTLGSTLQKIQICTIDPIYTEVLHDPDIYSWRTWKRIDIFNLGGIDNFPIDDDFMLQVAPKCQLFLSPFNETFTVEGTIALLKKCLLENRFNQQFNLGCIVLGNVPYNKVADQFREEFESADVVLKRKIDLAYQVRIQHGDKTYEVRFHLPWEYQ